MSEIFALENLFIDSKTFSMKTFLSVWSQRILQTFQKLQVLFNSLTPGAH